MQEKFIQPIFSPHAQPAKSPLASDIATTQRYAHLSEGYKKEAVELLDKDFTESWNEVDIKGAK